LQRPANLAKVARRKSSFVAIAGFYLGDQGLQNLVVAVEAVKNVVLYTSVPAIST